MQIGQHEIYLAVPFLDSSRLGLGVGDRRVARRAICCSPALAVHDGGLCGRGDPVRRRARELAVQSSLDKRRGTTGSGAEVDVGVPRDGAAEYIAQGLGCDGRGAAGLQKRDVDGPGVR